MNAPKRSDAPHVNFEVAPRAMLMKPVRSSNQTNFPLRHAVGEEFAGPRLPIDVRTVVMRDLFALHAVSQRLALDLPLGGCIESDPVMVSLKQLMPFSHHDHPLLVARSERRLLGYAHFQVIGPDRRWMLQGVGSNMGVYEADPVWEELFRGAVVTAGLDGTKRLFARLPSGSPVIPAARRIGFTPYVSECIWGSTLVPVSRSRRGVRRQEQSDVWAIHQLYTGVVPRQVQYAEALTSHSWDVTANTLTGSAKFQSWLAEDGHHVVAYARVISHPSAHTIECLVDPEHRDIFLDLLSTVFAELGHMSARRVYVTVRGYQVELATILQGFGMSVHLDQDVHIKYTTVSNWAPVVNLSPFSADIKEPSAKRVPTFMHGSHGDPSSEGAGSQ